MNALLNDAIRCVFSGIVFVLFIRLNLTEMAGYFLFLFNTFLGMFVDILNVVILL